MFSCNILRSLGLGLEGLGVVSSSVEEVEVEEGDEGDAEEGEGVEVVEVGEEEESVGDGGELLTVAGRSSVECVVSRLWLSESVVVDEVVLFALSVELPLGCRVQRKD